MQVKAALPAENDSTTPRSNVSWTPANPDTSTSDNGGTPPEASQRVFLVYRLVCGLTTVITATGRAAHQVDVDYHRPHAYAEWQAGSY